MRVLVPFNRQNVLRLYKLQLCRKVLNIDHAYAQRNVYMKSFIAKRLNSILVNLRYLRFKLLKYRENNKKICNTFDHNFKNIPLYIMRKVSLERYYFVLYDCAFLQKFQKWRLSRFAIKLFISIMMIKMLIICLEGVIFWNDVQKKVQNVLDYTKQTLRFI